MSLVLKYTTNPLSSSLQTRMLERKLREDIEHQIADVLQLERQLMGHLSLIHEKKRQLEIKKRSPIQCLVNLVSCWKKWALPGTSSH